MAGVPQMTANELSLLVKGSAPHFILDIREIHEVESGHLEQSVHIPMAFCLSRQAEIPRDIPVAVYCRSGARSSAIVSALMTKYGFTNLHSLTGGITAWAKDIDPQIEVG
ncbi:rhodanese-like domain-containing protein [Flavobacteriales bacterium]|nr:rhodanese-like domain-containing protein [Flavobacteriales bacterium]